MKYTPIIMNKNHPLREFNIILSTLCLGFTILILAIFHISELITNLLCTIFILVMLLLIIECLIYDKVYVNPRESGEEKE